MTCNHGASAEGAESIRSEADLGISQVIAGEIIYGKQLPCPMLTGFGPVSFSLLSPYRISVPLMFNRLFEKLRDELGNAGSHRRTADRYDRPDLFTHVE